MATKPLTQRHRHLLQQVTTVLSQHGFSHISHGRLSIETLDNTGIEPDITKSAAYQQSRYQGLSQAQYQHKTVMVKWQLNPACAPSGCPMVKKALDQAASHDLTVEIDNLHQITQQLQSMQFAKSAHLHTGHLYECIVPLLASASQTMTFYQQPAPFTFYAMPLLPQGSVHHYAKCQRLTYAQKIALLVAIAQCLSRLHQAGWLHGDVKPSNVLLEGLTPKTPTGKARAQYRTWLNDLAYAQPIVPTIRTPANKGANKATTAVSVTPRGTPAYVAPECWQGRAMSVASDIYAFGVLAYELITEQKPFMISRDKAALLTSSTNPLAAWALVHCQTPIPLLTNDVAQADKLQPIINQLLAKNVKHRYQSMHTVLYDLKNVAQR